MLFVRSRGDMAVLTAGTAIPLHHNAMVTWTDRSFFSRGHRVNGGSACSYCSIVISQFY